MPAQAGIQEAQAQAAGESPWIPAFAGMTSPPSPLQTYNPSPQLDQTVDSSPLPTRGHAWSSRSLTLVGVVLLIGVIVAVQYFSLSLPSTQPLTSNTQSLPRQTLHHCPALHEHERRSRARLLQRRPH